MMTLTCGCSSSKNNSCSRSGLYYDTIVTVTLFSDDKAGAEALLDECMNICAHYEELFDKNIKTSNIARINSAGTEKVTVDHDTAVMITKALEYSEITSGAFDITVEPVTRLWDFHEGAEKIPDEIDIKNALSSVGYKGLTVDETGNTVTKKDKSISIDTGGAAKGFVADKLADYLMSCSITGAIINMGGDMKLLGKKPNGDAFNIGINDPDTNGQCIMSLSLSDSSVATSGIYERCFEKDGKRYHHILDTNTGYPCDTDIESVTVITKDALAADCLCTCCITLGSQKALNLIEELDGTEAVFILTDGSIIQTEGAKQYIRN